jgi:hypothetical protein
MDKILAEFLLQTVKVVFFIVVLILAVRLGINMAKNKNTKNTNNKSEE